MLEKITQEIIDYSKERTYKHINLVKKYCNLFGLDRSISDIHDGSKLTDEAEYEPYILINWSYKLLSEGKQGLEYTEEMHNATYHHIKNNRHHPEYWSSKVENILNKQNRDLPNEIVDATKMPDEYITEMVADWCAVAEERNSKVKDWADLNIGKRWLFSKNQIELIYNLITKVSGENI